MQSYAIGKSYKQSTTDGNLLKPDNRDNCIKDFVHNGAKTSE